jgi:hypothetical protein
VDKPVTGPEYLNAIKQLGLNQSEAGRFFGVHEVTGRRWASDGPPAPVAKMLRFMLAMGFSASYVDSRLSAPLGN